MLEAAALQAREVGPTVLVGADDLGVEYTFRYCGTKGSASRLSIKCLGIYLRLHPLGFKLVL